MSGVFSAVLFLSNGRGCALGMMSTFAAGVVMTDLVERLEHGCGHADLGIARLCSDAKHEIERLRKLHGDGADDETIAKVIAQQDEIERLRGAHKKILRIGERHTDSAVGRRIADFRKAIDVAREALGDD